MDLPQLTEIVFAQLPSTPSAVGDGRPQGASRASCVPGLIRDLRRANDSPPGLLQLHREMQVGYCRLVTVSTDNLLETNEFCAGVGAHWTFLSDPGRKVQKDLHIAEYTDPDHNPMIPHALVLELGLRVFKIYNGYWFFGRPTVEELRLDLRAVLQRCRPDWDISNAEQRTAWATGEKAGFHPYGKTRAQVLTNKTDHARQRRSRTLSRSATLASCCSRRPDHQDSTASRH